MSCDLCDSNITHLDEKLVPLCDSHGRPRNKRSVCLIVERNEWSFNGEPMFLGISRGANRLDWGFPGGKVDPNDLTDWDAAAREAEEECGITVRPHHLLVVQVKSDGGPDGFVCTAFFSREAGMRGNPRTMSPREGTVRWMPLSAFISSHSTFREFNVEAFKVLGYLT